MTPAEVAERLGFSTKTVLRLFEKEPGVIILERSAKLNKRRHRTIRIPGYVYERVLKRLSVAA